MTLLRRLAYATLTLAFAQIVFGAIVRITGSGLGCGDHWPRCNGAWFPPQDRTDLLIEITHRYIAAALVVAILGLLAAAVRRRRTAGVGGPSGVLRPVLLAAGVVLTAAIFGAITVKMGLNPYVIVTHLAIAMTLLAILALTAIRAGGFGARTLTTASPASPRTYRAARGAVLLTFLALVFGALTANVAGANASCIGFPWCRAITVHGTPLGIQLTHRVIAFLLFFHLLGMVMAARKRGAPPVLSRAIAVAFGAVILQLLVAATLVELHLPAIWRSLHQAVGTLVWLAVFVMATLARYATPQHASVREAIARDGDGAPHRGDASARGELTPSAAR